MSLPIQSKTRLQIRQSIGRNLGAVIVGTCSGDGDNASLIDTYGLGKGGTDDHKGKQVYITESHGTGAAAAGDKSWVTSFDATNKDATLAPALSGTGTKSGKGYELWSGYTVEDVDDKINEAIRHATDDILIDKVSFLGHDSGWYKHSIPSGFAAIHTVEYVQGIGTDTLLEDCDTVWSELVDGDVTATADTSVKVRGSASLKLAVAAGCSANDILATQSISSKNLADHDEALIWIYSTTALDAGDIQLLLDDTASCASPVETLDIPATSANKWTRHIISLANAGDDTAIISVGLKMAVDKGAFTLYADDIRAQLSLSRKWEILRPNLWRIESDNDNLHFSYNSIPDGALLKISGYQAPSEITADSTSCEIDPDYVIAYATGLLLASKAGGREVDPDDRLNRSKFWLSLGEDTMRNSRTIIAMNTRWV